MNYQLVLDEVIKNLNGVPKLYLGECQTFPNCHYTVDDLPKFNINQPAKINGDFIFTIFLIVK